MVLQQEEISTMIEQRRNGLAWAEHGLYLAHAARLDVEVNHE